MKPRVVWPPAVYIGARVINSGSVALPVGTANGDLVIVFAPYDTGSNFSVSGGGAGVWGAENFYSPSSGYLAAARFKTITDATVGITLSGSFFGPVVILTYRGANSVSAIAYADASSDASIPYTNAPGMSPGAVGRVALLADSGAADGGTQPTNYTLVTNTTTGGVFSTKVAHQLGNLPGGITSPAWTTFQNGNRKYGILFEMRNS